MVEDGDNDDESPSLTLMDGNRFEAHDEDLAGANDEAMAIRLSILEEEHRDLDTAIRSLEDNSPYDRLSIARLKKRKLQLKDKIQEIKDAMLPDIIA
ncbi:MAG: DUF465 domain-containing protein [Pseudomonadota bacterium]